MAISEFEKQRQANIARNKELLRQLNLTQLANEFGKSESGNSSPEPKPKPKTRKPTVKIEKEAPLPLRRSRRIAGVNLDDSEAVKVLDALDEEKSKQEKLKELESVRLSDDLKLSEVISDTKMLEKLGKSFSMGDFFEEIKNKPLAQKSDEQARDELDKLELYESFHPNQIMLTNSRMTTIEFHPSNNRKLVFGGDTNGMLGVWTVDDDSEDEPAIIRFTPHRKNIARICVRPEVLEEVVSSSYDGSIRTMDLTKNISKCIVEYDDQWGDASGISDFKFIDKNIGYLTTLQGEFSIFDLRVSDPVRRDACVANYRLHDKKIGYFSVCPTDNKLIASASLDRTMRIWDLRNIHDQVWSGYEDVKGPQCVAAYGSRLSVSCTDWNRSGDIVCNGYDDSIRIFNMNKGDGIMNYLSTLAKPETGDINENLTPDVTIKHNCQSGRWVSILKSRWHERPRDGVEKFVIANMKKSLDVYSREGTMLAHINDERMTSVPAVCCFHPTENWIVGGNSSGKTFLLS
ncbi:Cmr1 protein [Pichia kluyveri]|uniref:DNA damage-binding protein CMR1 n=1 Tax=Pichia kluyveri TaxID=36015 RepID=A0AAV5R2S9_PICKL|nr:Cmr1 protein [Pichia kluyveri]